MKKPGESDLKFCEGYQGLAKATKIFELKFFR